MSFDPDAAAAAGSGIFGLESTEAEASVVLLPIPMEATTSYGGGAAQGPQAILQASHQVELFDLQTGHPYKGGIHLAEADPELCARAQAARVDAEAVIEGIGLGALPPELLAAQARVNEASAWIEAHSYARAKALIEAGKLVGVIGGDHSVPLGSIRAHAEAYGPIGILQLDAHADLRVAYEGFVQSHASIMERVLATAPGVVQLVQVGLRDVGVAEHARISESERIRALWGHELARARAAGQILSAFDEAVAALPARVYCSIDIDGLDPSLCPGTGTPVPGGLSFEELNLLLEAIVCAGKQIVGFDLCEVAPRPDDEWDGNVGARVLYKLIGWAQVSRA